MKKRGKGRKEKERPNIPTISDSKDLMSFSVHSHYVHNAQFIHIHIIHASNAETEDLVIWFAFILCLDPPIMVLCSTTLSTHKNHLSPLRKPLSTSYQAPMPIELLCLSSSYAYLGSIQWIVSTHHQPSPSTTL